MASSDTSLQEILDTLICFPTLAERNKDMVNCFEYLENFLNKANMKVNSHQSKLNPSLVATSKSTKHPKVILQAHIDVVPAKAKDYKLTKTSGKYHGRGVYDMKFAAACYLRLAEELSDKMSDLDFGIMFTADEESGGQNGVKYLLDEGYSANVCILPDGGNDWKIEKTSNAAWIAKLSSNGISAHGSRPWEGKNAINNLLEGLSEIHHVFGELKPHKNSVTISKIRGGEAFNQVPDYAEATIDMRFVNDKEYQKIKKKIELIAKDLDLKIETIARMEARDIDIEEPNIKSFLKISEKIIGKPIESTHSFGTTDACHFAKHSIPTIVIRPPGGGAHSSAEWLDIEGLEQFYQILKIYITDSSVS
jgi:succinyl-diaminopimelate desuccinylase